MKSFFNVLFGMGLLSTPLLANFNENDFVSGGLLGGFAFLIIILVIEIFFLMSQNSFAQAMSTKNPQNNTGAVWIWTQLIPIWSLVAIPVTLIKLNNQFLAFSAEKHLSAAEVKTYSNVWGWIWYGGTIASLLFPVFGLIALVGLIGFWIHINSVKKSILLHHIMTEEAAPLDS